jgi:hypothetical protein
VVTRREHILQDRHQMPLVVFLRCAVGQDR